MGKKLAKRLRRMEERIALVEAQMNEKLKLVEMNMDFQADATDRRLRSLRDDLRGDIHLVVKGVANTNARLNRLQNPKAEQVHQKDVLEILLPRTRDLVENR